MLRRNHINKPFVDNLITSYLFLKNIGFNTRGIRQAAKVIYRSSAIISHRTKIEGIRRPAATDISIAVPFDTTNSNEGNRKFRIAAIVHAFYSDLASEIKESLLNIPGHVDILMTTDTDEKRQELHHIFSDWRSGIVDIRVTPNRGRDFYGKVVEFRTDYHRYDIVIFLHTKKTFYIPDGDAWRRHLFSSLCGSPQIVRSILDLFQADDSVGMVAAQTWGWVRKWMHWGSNYVNCVDLAARMGIRLTPGHLIDFPAGSMFWCRPAALHALLSLELVAEDFPAEPLSEDGTIAHAMERLLFYCCEASGLKWLKISKISDNEESSRQKFITANRDLAATIREIAWPLLPSVFSLIRQ